MLNQWVSELNHGIGVTMKVKQTIFHGISDFQTVDIVDTEALGRVLFLDGLVMTSEKDEFIYHEMITHIPLCTVDQPKKVLVIGGGDGGTVREVLRHPSVEQVDLCEIDKMVVDASMEYLPTIANKLTDPRVNVIIADGVEFMRNTADETYDVILIDSTDPIDFGEGLFTSDFYRDVFRSLKPDGVMANQSESPFANESLLLDIQKKLNQIFPIVRPYFAPIYTYPGGYWSWTFASKTIDPLVSVDLEKAETIAQNTEYYNEQIHESAFAMPNRLRKKLKEAQTYAQSFTQ